MVVNFFFFEEVWIFISTSQLPTEYLSYSHMYEVVYKVKPVLKTTENLRPLMIEHYVLCPTDKCGELSYLYYKTTCLK